MYKNWCDIPNNQLMKMGYNYMDKRNMPDSAMLCFSLIANRYYKLDSHIDASQCYAEAMNDIGILYASYYNDYQKAYDYFLMAEDIAKKNKDKTILPEIYFNFGNIDLIRGSIDGQIGFEDKVLKEYKKAFYEALEIKKDDYLRTIIIGLASTAFNCNKIPSVKKELELYISHKDINKKVYDKPEKYFCLSILDHYSKNYKKSISDIDSSIISLHNTNVMEGIQTKSILMYTKMQILFDAGYDNEAMGTIHDIEQMAHKYNLHLTLVDIYYFLYERYKEKGQSALAEKYELMYFREKNFIQTENKMNGVGERRFLFEINKMTNEAKIMAYKDSVKNIIIILVVFFVLILTVMLIILFRRFKQTRRSNELLYKKNQELLQADKERMKLISSCNEDNESKSEKYKKSSLDEEFKSDLLHKIFIVMETNKIVYSDSFSLDKLSELVGATRNNVSQVINEKYGMSFHSMLNEYRIKEVCRRMNDQDNYGKFTIEAIAESVGINSRSYFVRTFKKFTGLTPSTYLKMSKEKNVP
jgi:AraC-like DNA-binding protein